MNKIYFKASVNNTFIYVMTTKDLMPKLYDHFTDGGYVIKKVEASTIDEALKDGGIVYYATDETIVDEFIDNDNTVKEIRNND